MSHSLVILALACVNYSAVTDAPKKVSSSSSSSSSASSSLLLEPQLVKANQSSDSKKNFNPLHRSDPTHDRISNKNEKVSSASSANSNQTKLSSVQSLNASPEKFYQNSFAMPGYSPYSPLGNNLRFANNFYSLNRFSNPYTGLASSPYTGFSSSPYTGFSSNLLTNAYLQSLFRAASVLSTPSYNQQVTFDQLVPAELKKWLQSFVLETIKEWESKNESQTVQVEASTAKVQ